jgi:hypothetical protein
VLPATWAHHFHVRGLSADPDGDGLTNRTEYLARTNPRRADTDRDGTTDGATDRDHDGLTNLTEQRAGTDPGSRDSDRDGLADGREDADHDGLSNRTEQQTANDPGDPDSDDSGIKDGSKSAGLIVGFDQVTRVLTERLASTGKVVTGTVDDAADVQCSSTGDLESAYDDTATSDDDTSDDPSGDDSEDDGTDDPGTDDPGAADDGSEDDVTIDLAARFSAPLARIADDAGDDGTDDLADDQCATEVLTAGSWIHAATTNRATSGLSFAAITLVDDGQ